MRRLALLLLLIPVALSAQAPTYDLILRGGRIIDGTASPWYRADVAIKGDTIVRIAPSITEPAARVVDVTGLVVAPGFIDIHTHARRGIFEVPTADNYVRQGVTTLIEGPDGSSPVPLGPFLAKVQALRITPNFAMLHRPGHDAERGDGRGRSACDDGRARPDARARHAGHERRRVRVELRAVLRARHLHAHRGSRRAGAGRGARWAASTSRTCATKPTGLQDSVRETIAIGEQGGLPTQITHHKVVGKNYWGQIVETLRMVDEARARGVDATIDQYPYTASATSIGAALLPAWAQEGGREATLKRLKDPATRAKIKAESVGHHPRRARRRRSEERVGLGLPVGSDAGAARTSRRSRRRAASRSRSRTRRRPRCGSSSRAAAAASSTPSARRICSASSCTRRR